jgi:hypothetical protein
LLKCLMWRRWYQSANLPVLVLFRIQTPYNQRSSYTSIDSLEDKIVYDVYQNSLTNIIIFTLSDRSFKFNRLYASCFPADSLSSFEIYFFKWKFTSSLLLVRPYLLLTCYTYTSRWFS